MLSKKDNEDLSKANEITKEDAFSTNLYAEKQLIEAIRSPERFQEKVQKATQELQDMKRVVVDTIENKGKDDRNFLEMLNNQRRGTALRNLLANDLHEILQHSSDIQGDTKALLENFGKDLGLDVKVIFAEGEKLPKESQNSKGAAYVNGTSKETTIVIDTSKITNTKEFIGTSMEELSHIIDKVAGRQDESVLKDNTTKEKGLESLGRPINNYFQEEFASSNKEIRLQPDGKDYSKLDLGEKLGDWGLEDEYQLDSANLFRY